MVVKTTEGHVFGAFTPRIPSPDGLRYTGTGETWVFTATPTYKRSARPPYGPHPRTAAAASASRWRRGDEAAAYVARRAGRRWSSIVGQAPPPFSDSVV